MPCPKCGSRLRYKGKKRNLGRRLVCTSKKCDYKRDVSPNTTVVSWRKL